MNMRRFPLPTKLNWVRQQILKIWRSRYVEEALALAFTICLALLAARACTYFLTERSGIPLISRLRGIGSDSFFGSLVAFVIILVPYAWVRSLLVVLFLYLAAGNIEHVLSNGANLNYTESAELAQPVFILGSALSMPVLWKFALLLGVFMAGMWLLEYGMAGIRKKITVAFIALSLLPTGQVVDSDWYEYNLAESNILLMEYILSHQNLPRSAVTPDQIQKIYHVDLNGTPFTHTPVNKPNVLIITIEALSEQHLRSGWTPHLKERISQALYYRNYIAPNRITVNGHYSMLCGDYPGLDSRLQGENSDKIAKVNKRNKAVACLPHILRGEGYATRYVQATNTNYRDERRFMNLIGFQSIMDDSNFEIKGQRNDFWGPIDDIVFQNAKKGISELVSDPDKKPWFMMIMTEGTHQPFTVPQNCAARNTKGASDEEKTYRCMDEALDNFIKWLDETGVLKNTLVLITSDEAIINGGMPANVANNVWMTYLLNNNHGFLMVLTPDKVAEVKKDYFMQPDLLVSMLDYIGLPKYIESHDFGRSIFRDYNEFRPLYFSMVYLNIFHMMPDAEHLITCYRTRGQCKKFYLPDKKLFYSDYNRVPISSTEITSTQDISAIIEQHLARPVNHESIPQTKQ